MTAGKNQAQPIIFKAIILKAVLFLGLFRRTPLRLEISHELVLRRIKSCPSTQSINGFESGRRNQPWSGVIGYSTPRPQAQRSRKGFVHRLLGKIKITEQADQSCQDPSRIHAIKGVEQFAYLLRETLGHDDDFSKPATPNQFGKRRIDAKCPGRDSEIWINRTASSIDAKSPMHSLSFVQAQRFRVAPESRAIRKLPFVRFLGDSLRVSNPRERGRANVPLQFHSIND